MSYAKLSALNLDQRVQSRAGGLDEPTVERYVESIESSKGIWPFPPLDIFIEGGEIKDGEAVGGVQRIGAGFHRFEAATRYNQRHPEAPIADAVPANLHIGGYRDAFLFNARSNAAHGLAFSETDKQNIVVTLLLDEEWSGWSDNMLADKAGVSQPLVSKIRKVLSAIADGEDVASAALAASVSTQYVDKILTLLPAPPPEPAAEGDKGAAEGDEKPAKGAAAKKAAGKDKLRPAVKSAAARASAGGKRKVSRQGKEYEMQTGKIGAAKKAGGKKKGEAAAEDAQGTLPTEPAEATPEKAAPLPKKKKGSEEAYVKAVIEAERPRIELLRDRLEATEKAARELIAEYNDRGEMCPAAAGGEDLLRLLEQAVDTIQTKMIPASLCECKGKGCAACLGSGWVTSAAAPAS